MSKLKPFDVTGFGGANESPVQSRYRNSSQSHHDDDDKIDGEEVNSMRGHNDHYDP